MNPSNIPSPNLPDEPAPVRRRNGWTGDPPQPTDLTIAVTGLDTATSERFGKTAPIVAGTTAEGEEWEVAGWRSHLRQVIEDAGIEIGAKVAFRAFGQDPTGQYLYACNVARNGDEPGI